MKTRQPALISFSFALALLWAAPAVGATLYVKNDALPGGNGSLEHPFDTLLTAEQSAEPDDTIVVLAGDGTTTGQDQGIVLQDGQSLFGIDQPAITHQDGDGVVLASANEVSGLVLVEVSGSGTPGTGAGSGIFGEHITDFSIHGNTVSESFAGPGVVDGAGSGIIAFNTLLENRIGTGVAQLSGGNLEATFLANQISGGDHGITATSQNDSNLSLWVLENIVDGAGEGLAFDAGSGAEDSSRLTAILAANQVTLAAEPNDLGSDRIGIQISSNSEAVAFFDLHQNLLSDPPEIQTDPELPAWALALQSYLTSHLSATLTDNAIHGTDGVEISAQDDSRLDLGFVDNEIVETRGRLNGNWGDQSTGFVRILDNTFTRCLDGGISIDAEFQAAMALTVSGNQIVDTGDRQGPEPRSGIVFGQPSQSNALVRITSNAVTGSTGRGIEITNAGSSVLLIDISDNHLSGNDLAGLELSASGQLVCLRLNHNTGEDPLVLQQTGATLLLLEPPRNNENPIHLSGQILPVARGTCFPGILSDGFESGDTSAWSAISGAEP